MVPWRALRVWNGSQALYGGYHLAMLLRWWRGDALLGLLILDSTNAGRPVDFGTPVDWTGFPLKDAIAALMGSAGRGTRVCDVCAARPRRSCRLTPCTDLLRSMQSRPEDLAGLRHQTPTAAHAGSSAGRAHTHPGTLTPRLIGGL